MESWFSAHRAWWLSREEIAMGYKTEQKEFEEKYPQPTLKYYMIALSNPFRKEM